MLFPTIEFAIFFALVFPITWTLNRFNTLKKIFLVAASYVFYGFWSIDYLWILFGSSVANYLVALRLGQLSDGPLRTAVLWVAIAGNLGVLIYFKYANFFVASFIDASNSIGLPVNVGFVEVALPIAISFLTFHALSYIIDVYRRTDGFRPTRSLIDILLYISFFPHLVAGPIVRARDFLAQTRQRSDPRTIEIGASVLLIVGGLFKKVVIAKLTSRRILPTRCFEALPIIPASTCCSECMPTRSRFIAIFSAYTDIAIGVASLLGYKFPQNFNQPYRATSLQDFWRRWHITLSSWLRDYLYVSLGGNGRAARPAQTGANQPKRRLFTYRNLLITMVLGGTVAWRELEFHHLGSDARRGPRHGARHRHHVLEARWLIGCDPCGRWMDHHVPLRLRRMGIFSVSDA